MDKLSQIFLILIPASLVLFGMYITVKSMINGQNEVKLIEVKSENKKITLPLQLQAYERICLLLERISPQNILIRLNGKVLNVADFHQVLINEIRDEFNHNHSQQIYMSDNAWTEVKNAVELTIGNINEAAMGLDPQANGIELSKSILKTMIKAEHNIIEKALQNIKAEARANIFV